MCLESNGIRRGRIMVGSMRKLDWAAIDASLDEVLSELSVDEIWVEDLTCHVIDRYIILSGHKVVHHNTYPKKRFQNALTKKRLLKKGWICRRRCKYSFLKIGREKRRIKHLKLKAFRIGEEE